MFCGQRRLGAMRRRVMGLRVGAVKHTAPSVPRCLVNGQRFPLCLLIKTHAEVSQQSGAAFAAFGFLKPLPYHHVYRSAGPDGGTYSHFFHLSLVLGSEVKSACIPLPIKIDIVAQRKLERYPRVSVSISVHPLDIKNRSFKPSTRSLCPSAPPNNHSESKIIFQLIWNSPLPVSKECNIISVTDVKRCQRLVSSLTNTLSS